MGKYFTLQLIDKERKKKITNDWAKMLPDMKKMSNMWFKRRVGPLMMAVHLKAPDLADFYYPVFWVYDFCFKNDFVTMIMNLDTCPCVREPEHEETYRQKVEHSKKMFWLPIDGAISLDDIFQGYKRYHETAKHTRKDVSHITGPALIAAWAGELQKAKEYAAWAEEVRQSWNLPEPDKDDLTRIKADQREEQEFEYMKTIIYEPYKLRQIVKDEVVRLKCTKIPFQNIAGTNTKNRDDYPPCASLVVASKI